MLPVIKTVSPQTTEVYKLLNAGEARTAQEIAEQLGILPNAVYRVAKKLMGLGMIEELAGYPARFQAVPAQMATSLYLVAAMQNFRREFGLNSASTVKKMDTPVISLIKDRPSLLERQLADIRAAQHSIDFIVSGHNVPDDTLLAYRQAMARGVTMRMIIHQRSQINSPETCLRSEMGMHIRFLPDFDMRLFVYDERIVYLTSYDAKRPGSAFGVRFEYVPLALQMSEVFEQNWQRAEIV